MKHTPEPWSSDSSCDWSVIGSDGKIAFDDGSAAGEYSPACTLETRDRIIACVNACAGFNPEVLATLPDQIIECFSNWKGTSDAQLNDIASDEQNVHWKLANLILTARRAKEKLP